MSQPDYNRAVERLATDSAFAAAVHADPAAALAGYELTEPERQSLQGLQAEAPTATAAAAPVALATRRSKTSMLGLGVVGAAAAAGAATFGFIRLQPPTYARYMSLDAGARQAVSTVALDNAGDIGAGTPPSSGKRQHAPLAIVKKVDSSSPVLAQDAATGRPIRQVTVIVQKGGSDWLVEDGSDCLVTSLTASSLSGSDAPTEKVAFVCAALLVSYPNGGS